MLASVATRQELNLFWQSEFVVARATAARAMVKRAEMRTIVMVVGVGLKGA